jgi:hypothetical protein
MMGGYAIAQLLFLCPGYLIAIGLVFSLLIGGSRTAYFAALLGIKALVALIVAGFVMQTRTNLPLGVIEAGSTLLLLVAFHRTLRITPWWFTAVLVGLDIVRWGDRLVDYLSDQWLVWMPVLIVVAGRILVSAVHAGRALQGPATDETGPSHTGRRHAAFTVFLSILVALPVAGTIALLVLPSEMLPDRDDPYFVLSLIVLLGMASFVSVISAGVAGWLGAVVARAHATTLGRGRLLAMGMGMIVSIIVGIVVSVVIRAWLETLS